MAEHRQSTPSDGDQTTQDGLHIWSCVNCRRRKLRCDRHHPCANCVRSKIDCHFPVTGRIPRRSRLPPTNPAQKQSELLGRLRRLEAVVTELSGQIEDGTIGSSSATSEDTAALWQKGNDPTEDFGSLVTDADGSLRVAKGFWSIFCTEVDNIFQAVSDVTDASPADELSTSDEGSNVAGSIRSHHQRFVLGSPLDTHADDVKLLPLPSQVLFLWQTFCDNVDPFITVLDIPTTTNMIYSIKGNFATLSSADRALMISISLAAVVSLDEEEVSLNFGVPRPQLLARLRLATEQALASAEFMTTRSLVVAQAFAIYTSILPQLGATKLAAPMTAILVRVALSLGLHRDPETSKQGQASRSTADIEMRRRLWWQICFLDARVRHKDAPELSISPTTATTKEPNDDEDKASGEPKFSSIYLCRIRCDLWHLSHSLRNIAKDDTDSQKRLLLDTQTRIGETYFSNIDESNSSFRSFAYLLTRLFFSQVEYTIQSHQPRSEAWTWSTLVATQSLMETTLTLNTRPEWSVWRWQLQGYAPWTAMITTLHILSRGAWTTEADQAWSTLRRLANALPGEAHDLRVLQVIKRRIEDIAKSRKEQGIMTNEDQSPTRDQGPVPETQSLNQSQAYTAESELPIHFDAGNGEPDLSSLQESWNLMESADDTMFQWGDVQETDDMMDWQFMDGSLDTSMYWGQQPF